MPATPTAPDAPVDPNAPAFNFNEETWDFGSIPQGIPVTHVYEFVNSGKQPLEISMVSTSCGCTTPEFTKDAVNPGVKGKSPLPMMQLKPDLLRNQSLYNQIPAQLSICISMVPFCQKLLFRQLKRSKWLII